MSVVTSQLKFSSANQSSVYSRNHLGENGLRPSLKVLNKYILLPKQLLKTLCIFQATLWIMLFFQRSPRYDQHKQRTSRDKVAHLELHNIHRYANHHGQHLITENAKLVDKCLERISNIKEIMICSGESNVSQLKLNNFCSLL